MRGARALAAALPLLLLAGCGRIGALPYAREIEDMSLMRTLGVDAAQAGVQVTASTGADAGGAGSARPTVVSGGAGSISAAVLDLQARGDGYLYFGHVGQLLLGEELARRGAGEALEYVLRDVEMRLDTNLYFVRGAQAGEAISAAAEEGSAACRLEAREDDAGLLSSSMPRTVGDVLCDLSRCGASFAPAITAGGGLESAGYAVLKDGALAGWAEGDAALGINLLLGRVDAGVVELPVSGGAAVLRVVGAKTRVRPVFDGDVLTGLAVDCAVDANLAEGRAGPGTGVDLEELREGLARVQAQRVRAALELCRALDADFLDLKSAAGLAAPWRWAEIGRQWELGILELDVRVTATVERSYDAVGQAGADRASPAARTSGRGK